MLGRSLVLLPCAAIAVLAATPARAVLDVELGQLYGIISLGHEGPPAPDGISGLSAATTSCNVGDVNVPWNAPMAEDHPFIGLAMYRLRDGALEMIGKNWIKHGFFALSNSQCTPCQNPTKGDSLGVGCSDTYSATHNGTRFYLGPREEVNPWTGDWEACGSYFDAQPVDCERDYFGTGHDSVEHRLEVLDADLGNQNSDGSDARYFYEGVYFVADDDNRANNIGWRECTMTWNGALWLFSDLPGDTLDPWAPLLGPVVETWGDFQDDEYVGADDGNVILSVQASDLGGGTWRYEYALYNRQSDRGLRSFAVPVAEAALSNVAFHDPDSTASNDWAHEVAGGLITWSTEEWAVDPDANALHYQTMFNFRFDADRPPVPSRALAGIFKPGPGTTVLLDTRAPATGSTSVAGGGREPIDPVLSARPNPFSNRTRVLFALPREGRFRLSVVDVTGRTVQVLLEGVFPAGAGEAEWDGRNSAGARVAAGVYFFRFESAGGDRTTKATLLR